ncbi:hypothetical protein [Mesorhizobium sp.]|uniref:hypothetical protein n=1 Tax=Mesorhizobium sp. TaxID=1871066 RepID=UPI000FE351D0|nr:hypothetical protein [Mesorhizobium sp.]RWK29816.1 MAG: hypothetical protein EOR40_26565 [Mesorhizobium sp.]RWK91054.1 MAG: hypothetical protein EOR52_05855 [Mesorhizobium sp.]TIP17924.1 MAG: hypothetical protein E5X66_18915 [Mesorhizobium sp.]TJV81325.1 MAG: hypothetical protein E5X45_16880 [Mesorhizobium sp.]TJW17200.1 MAG: hypothetical protein E5X42_16055 [Mesorhizobium sp.]
MKRKPTAEAAPTDSTAKSAQLRRSAGPDEKALAFQTVLPRPTVPPRILSGSDALQDVLGHSPTCIALSRQGAISSCDCRIRPLEDPAVVIGMIVRFVRMTGHGRSPLPSTIVELLFRQLQDGDPACLVIAFWLVDLGLLEARILPSSRRRDR